MNEQGTKIKIAKPIMWGGNILNPNEWMMRKSGIRESNPSHSLGKAGHSRYTNPAQKVILLAIPNAIKVQAAGFI